MDDTIQVSVAHVSEDYARRDIASVYDGGGREIEPATAVTIASWWQSPGGIGKALAAFASGSPVSRQELLDDIAATRTEHGYHTLAMLPRDRHALDCLSTFVLRHC
ncbi:MULTISPECIES: hypothetical protein [Mycobacterium avium complex (MAC)]|uniref:Uncharacterized protein n=1 Tax=Mycobacterium bouchedurhonense TaxID=701041 RepID=A0AAW5SCA2_MYCBC|nr:MULTISPECIES: hypothetical protein [Mycobacterium avium complex (MAC)]MBZ4631646.1 hypothetical protein [Mycobacterium avium subsp. hominissuis]MCV6993130.1 hypothetical protein [Mycobacterium bouchedurhonense]MCV6994096.1 hypothetical protein [Mycobacterium timonense]MDV3307070.1 hypothetical protein [Mycobacterium avium subsp. hominissuis]QWY65194.1 hypothetical protein BJP78_26075 [Mycobacterium avium subsp. hominissuis]